MDFHRDLNNIGNYSLNDDAMRARLFDTIQVECVDTAEWMRNAFRPRAEDRIIWKSDTQGYDELIVCRTPSDVFDRIEIAIMELWRIAKPAFDLDVFAARLDAFPNKRLGPETPCATEEVLEFLKGDDWQHEDLFLWK